MSHRKSSTVVSIVMLIAVLLMAACQPVTAPAPAPTSAPASAAAPAEATKAAPVTSERAKTLNIAVSKPFANTTSFNIYAPGFDRSRTGMGAMVWEYLFYLNMESGEFIPWLATDMKYNDAYTEITVHLRDGVKWSDGEKFTADDVVFTYDMLRKNPGMTWATEANKAVANVVKVDDLTVKFILTEPNPRLHLVREAFPSVPVWSGITIVPEHIWKAVKDPVTFNNDPPIGTGPYKLDKATANAYSYVRRSDWWGTTVFGVTPAPEKVNFINGGNETSVAIALAADEYDTPAIGILSPGAFASVKARNPNVEAWTKDPPYSWWDPCPRTLLFNNEHEPWNDPNLRKAVSMLIDRDKIVTLAYEGSTTTSTTMFPAYSGVKPYVDAIQDIIANSAVKTDPAAAEKLLTGAGYAKDDKGFWAKGGKRLAPVFLVNSDSPENMKVSKVVADQLKAGGIDVQLQTLSGAVQSTAQLNGDFDFTGPQAMCPGTIYENMELFHSKFYVPNGKPAPWYERNSFRYKNPKYDAVVDETLKAIGSNADQKTLIDIFKRGMAIWYADLPVTPLTQAPALVPFSTKYWKGWPTKGNPWMMPVNWWATMNLLLTGYQSPSTGKWVPGIQPAGQ